MWWWENENIADCQGTYTRQMGEGKMTNTYDEETAFELKQFEEMRCIRCALERILRVMDEGLFVDYEMEKFGKNYKTRNH